MPTDLSKDRFSLCSFSFADGRRCRTPRSPSHPHLCTFHARKEAQARASDQFGREISSYFSGQYLSACDLSSALGHLFSAVAQGHIKPKSASILAYLSQTLLQSIRLAEHEYVNAFGPDAWRRMIRSSFATAPATPPAPHPDPTTPPAAPPSTQPDLATAPPRPATAPAPPPSPGRISVPAAPPSLTATAPPPKHPDPATPPAPPQPAPNSQQFPSRNQRQPQPASPAESTLANLSQNKQLQPSAE